MKSLIIYNTTTGKIIMTQTGGEVDNVTAAAVTAEVPKGYYVDSIGADGKPVLKEIEKTEDQKQIDDLKAQVSELSESMLGLMDMVNNGTGA